MKTTALDYCGLNCEERPVFIATAYNDDNLGQKTAKEWSKLYGEFIKLHRKTTSLQGEHIRRWFRSKLRDDALIKKWTNVHLSAIIQKIWQKLLKNPSSKNRLRVSGYTLETGFYSANGLCTEHVLKNILVAQSR